MCSRFGTVTRYTYDIRTFHQSLLPCSIMVVWDEAPLKEPIRDLALHKLGILLSGLRPVRTLGTFSCDRAALLAHLFCTFCVRSK